MWAGAVSARSPAGPADPQGYVLDRETLYRKIEETIALDGDQILLQGGLHPELGLDWYESLLGDIKRRFPRIHVHGFSPPEVFHISQVSGLRSIACWCGFARPV